MGNFKDFYIQSEDHRNELLAEALGVSWSDLVKLDYEIQMQESSEGLLFGYIVKFSKDNDPEYLSKISGLSKTLSVKLSPWVFERTYEEQYALGAIFQNIDHFASFEAEMAATASLQELQVTDFTTRQILNRQIFISIIGALETYLSDTLISKTLGSEYFFENFVSTYPDFKKQKISISEVYEYSRNLKEQVKSVLVNNTIYHKLSTVKEMYENTFSIVFPDISTLQRRV